MKDLTINLDQRYAMIPGLARQYLGARGKLYGRDPNTGLDCLGLVAMAATQAGFDCPHMLIRTPDSNGKRPPMMKAIDKDMSRVGLKEIRAGDMLWLNLMGTWDHLAVICNTNPLTILHTDPSFGSSVIEHRLSEPQPYCGSDLFGLPKMVHVRWEDWVRGAFRFEYVWIEDQPDIKTIYLKSTRYGRETISRVKFGSGVPRF